MFGVQKTIYKVKAKVLATGQQRRYGARAETLPDEMLVNYVYQVTQDIKWCHWKKGVSVDNTDVKALLRLELLTCPEKHVVEVGAWMGRTTCALGLLAKLKGRAGKVIAVDTFTGDPKHTSQYSFVSNQMQGSYFPYFQENINKFGLEKIVVPVKGLSAEVYGEVKKLVKPQGAGLVYIDGDHTEEGVREDVEFYHCLTARGGWVVFDDYNSEAVYAGAESLRGRGDWRNLTLNRGKLGCFQRMA
jgi:transposase